MAVKRGLVAAGRLPRVVIVDVLPSRSEAGVDVRKGALLVTGLDVGTYWPSLDVSTDRRT